MISDEYVSAVDLAADIKDMKVSPSEVIEETIKAIDERNPSINASYTPITMKRVPRRGRKTIS